ncbi:MAG: cupin domain-containing protein [Nibricoccus sp.]
MSASCPTAAALIARLGLQPLPHEGGWFARTWTSHETLPNGRPLGTAIYFLLTRDSFSALHRLDADELWHFHAGDPIEHLQLSSTQPHSPDAVRVTQLGAHLDAGQLPQLAVPSGVWQGARLTDDARLGWALVSCTMSPGWDENGFELADRNTLHAFYPAHIGLISALTRTN